MLKDCYRRNIYNQIRIGQAGCYWDNACSIWARDRSSRDLYNIQRKEWTTWVTTCKVSDESICRCGSKHVEVVNSCEWLDTWWCDRGRGSPTSYVKRYGPKVCAFESQEKCETLFYMRIQHMHVVNIACTIIAQWSKLCYCSQWTRVNSRHRTYLAACISPGNGWTREAKSVDSCVWNVNSLSNIWCRSCVGDCASTRARNIHRIDRGIHVVPSFKLEANVESVGACKGVVVNLKLSTCPYCDPSQDWAWVGVVCHGISWENSTLRFWKRVVEVKSCWRTV